MKVLVVGATGELGTSIVRRLQKTEHEVRALVRPASAHEHLTDSGADVVHGDLRDRTSIMRACAEVDAVIATANAIVPRGRSSFARTEGLGYRHLVEACRARGVARFMFASVFLTEMDSKVPTFRYKRLNEERLMTSGLDFTIFRSSLFMEDWLALIGSSIPLRGSNAPTLRRPFWFTKLFMRLTGRLVEKRGRALIPGPSSGRHSFISADDVAGFMVGALDHDGSRKRVYDLGGPEALSWNEVIEIYGRLLGREVTAFNVPPGVYRAQMLLLRPFSEAAANIMGVTWAVASHDTAFDSSALADELDVNPITVEQFLGERLRRPA